MEGEVESYTTPLDTLVPTGNVTEDGYMYSVAAIYAIGSTFLSMAVVGVVFNLCSLCVILSGKHITREVKLQLVNQAVADFLLAMFFPALSMTNMLGLRFPESPSLCTFAMFTGRVACYASPLCNLVICLERFVVVCFPLRAQNYRKVHKFVVAVSVWVVAILLELEGLLYASITYIDGEPQCHVYAPRPQHLQTFWLTVMILKYLLPSVTIVILYIVIYCKLNRRRVACTSTRVHRSAQVRRRMDMLQRMFMFDAFLTLCTWLPYSFYITITQPHFLETKIMSEQDVIINATLAIVMATNSFSTPVVYFIFNRNYRKDLKLLFKSSCCQKKREIEETGRIKGSNIPKDSTSNSKESSQHSESVETQESIHM